MSEKYNKLDILLLTSREDPFSVVAIEAVSYSIPIICWDKGIGTKELIENGCGIIVPYLDIILMAEAIEKLYTDKDFYHQCSSKAKELSKNHDIEIAGPQIYTLIQKIAKS